MGPLAVAAITTAIQSVFNKPQPQFQVPPMGRGAGPQASFAPPEPSLLQRMVPSAIEQAFAQKQPPDVGTPSSTVFSRQDYDPTFGVHFGQSFNPAGPW
jgi:hypothetical protein